MVTVVGNVIYGVDFRKHMDRQAQIDQFCREIFEFIAQAGKDAGSIADTAPCEYVPPDNPA